MHYHLDDCDYQQHSRLHRIAVGMSTGQTWFCSLKPRHQTHNPFSLSTAWGGRCQWTGQWFPGCPSWDALDRKIAASRREDGQDGSFWMSFGDFYLMFNRLHVCCTELSPVPRARIDFHMSKERSGGCLSSKNSTTFRRNTPFLLSSGEGGNVVVSAMQRDERRAIKSHAGAKMSYPQIGFTLLEPAVENTPLRAVLFPGMHKVMAPGKFWNKRDVSVRLHVSPGGGLVVVPSCWDPGLECDMVLLLHGDAMLEPSVCAPPPSLIVSTFSKIDVP